MVVHETCWSPKVVSEGGPRKWSPQVVPEIRKNFHIQQKRDILKHSGVVGNSRKKLEIQKHVNIQKNEKFEQFGGSRNFQKNVTN